MQPRSSCDSFYRIKDNKKTTKMQSISITSAFSPFLIAFYTFLPYFYFAYIFLYYFILIKSKFPMNLKNEASAGTSVLQKLRHNIIAYIKSIIRQNEPVALKYCRFFLHKHFHEPRIDVLRGHPEPPLKLREGHPRCHP